MKTFCVAAFAIVLMAFATLSLSAEIPFSQAEFDATRDAGKPMAVVFHADWCPTCRAQAPILKTLSESRELSGVTLFVANFDTEKTLKRSLGITKQSTIVVIKDGKESARSTGDTQQESLSALLHHAIS
jgi:thiol-disulfide isomerase/thioredoxin